MKSQKDVIYCLVTSSDIDPATHATGYINAYGDMTDGEVALVNEAGYVYANAGGQDANTKVRLVARNGSKLVYSPFFYGRDVRSCHAFDYSDDGGATTQQVTYIGYNGTSYSIDYSNSTLYQMRVELQEDDSTGFGQMASGKLIKHAVYKSSSAATEYEVTHGITDSLINNIAREAVKPFTVEMIHSNAGVGCNIGIGTVTTINGSKIITAATDIDNNSDLAVGRLVRFGTTTTSPVYYITAMDTVNQTATLNIPYQGVTDTHAPNTEMEYITNALMTAGDFGIKLTGLSRASIAVPGKVPYSVVKFEAYPNGFNSITTPVTYTTAAVLGNGTYYQVNEWEYWSQCNRGNMYAKDYLRPSITYVGATGNTYNYYTIEVAQMAETGSINNVNRCYQIILAYPDGGANMTEANMTAILDDIMTITT